MKKHNMVIRTILPLLLCFMMLFLSSCIFNFAHSGMSKEECANDFEENHIPHMTEVLLNNEKIFNKVVDTLHAYVAGMDDSSNYKTISLGKYKIHPDDGDIRKYALFTEKFSGPVSDEIIREHIEFLNDKSINIHGLTESELDKIFAGASYDPNNPGIKYKEAFVNLSSTINGSSSSGDPAIGFTPVVPVMYNKADRIDAVLWYGLQDVEKDDPCKINDLWSITYSLYWSPAL